MFGMSHVLMKQAARNNISLLDVKHFSSLQTWQCFLASAWFGEWRQTLDERQAPSVEHVRGTIQAPPSPAHSRKLIGGSVYAIC